MSSHYLQVAEDENEEPMELPYEEDGTLLLTTLAAQFPGACGMKFRNPDSGSIRGIRLAEGHLNPPDGGWNNIVYTAVFPKNCKRKSEVQFKNCPAKTKRIVLGLPYKIAEQELGHFESHGEVLMTEVKKDLKSGQSESFGYIKFEDYNSQHEILSQRHLFNEKLCDVKTPNARIKLNAKKKLKEQKLLDNLNMELKGRRGVLLKALQEQLLKDEKVEEELREEMARKCEEKLLAEKNKFEKIINAKELEHKLLEKQLEAIRADNMQQQEMIQTRELGLNNTIERIELELQCSICSELFVQATTLNCSHSFCLSCISIWMKCKKECPICRDPITNMNKSIVLNSCIDKMVERMNDDMKLKRKELVEKRKTIEIVNENDNREITSDLEEDNYSEIDVLDDDLDDIVDEIADDEIADDEIVDDEIVDDEIVDNDLDEIVDNDLDDIFEEYVENELDWDLDYYDYNTDSSEENFGG